MTDAPEAPEPITKPNAEAALAAHGTNPWAIRDFRLIWLGRVAGGAGDPDPVLGPVVAGL